MLEPLQSEPFQTYALIALGSIVGASHGIIYLLSIVGLLLRPLWRQPVAFLYPWVRLTAETPDDITRTPFRPSRLLLIHTLWLSSSVGLWVVATLWGIVGALADIFPDVFGIDVTQSSRPYISGFQDWIYFIISAMYTGVFAYWSSLMWFGSLRRSLAHFRYMNSVRDGGGLDDVGHYLAPFRKATGWALPTLPIYIGLLVLTLVFYPPLA